MDIQTNAREIRHALVAQARGTRGPVGPRTPRTVTLNCGDLGASNGVEVLVLHATIERLAERNVLQGTIAELRFFAGLSVSEIAAALRIPETDIRREWELARRSLQRALGPTQFIAI